VFTFFSTLVSYSFIASAIYLQAVNPSSHEIRYKPFLAQYARNPKDEETKGNECGK
jgi:hypothetical protein